MLPQTSLPNQFPLTIDEIIFRNETLCWVLGYKTYKPKGEAIVHHESFYKRKLRWYVIPSVGNYCNAELKFHYDLNWLITAAIEFKKYEKLDPPGSQMSLLFERIKNTSIIDLDVFDFYKKLTDYSMAIYDSRLKNYPDNTTDLKTK